MKDMTFGEIAAEAGTTQVTVVRALVARGFLSRKTRLPLQRYENAGLFECAEVRKEDFCGKLLGFEHTPFVTRYGHDEILQCVVDYVAAHKERLEKARAGTA